MSAPGAQAVAAGWRAELALHFAPLAGATRLVARRHLGPLQVQRAFHPEGEVCHAYLLHPPGGVVGGDSLKIDVRVDAGASALLTGTAATKFYRSDGPEARLEQRCVLRDAALEWLPQECIYYPGARARLSSRFELHGNARLLAWEVACLGLPASGADFSSGAVHQSLELWHDGRQLLGDRVRLDPAMHRARWGLAGCNALGTLVAWPGDEASEACARAVPVQVPGLQVACTRLDGALLVRALGARGDQVRGHLAQVWAALRPGLMARAAVAPRIWAT
jgi:urease accessory protein